MNASNGGQASEEEIPVTALHLDTRKCMRPAPTACSAITTRCQTCICGQEKDHPIARRATADGTHVLLWSTGEVTGALGYKLPGVPMRRDLPTGRRFIDEVCLWDTSELWALYKAARKPGLPGEVRKRAHGYLNPPPKPVWEVVSADRDGRPTERVWRLPRLAWPGLHVFDVARGRGAGDRYQVWYEDRGHLGQERCVLRDTGMSFRTLTDLGRYLEEVRVRRT